MPSRIKVWDVLAATVLGTVALNAGCATGGAGFSATRAPAQNATAPLTIMQPRTPVPMTATAAHTAKPAKAGKASGTCRVNSDSVDWILTRGECRNGYVQGKGRARSVDGRRRYSGDFVAGYFDGQGSYDWGNGVRYTGTFLRGKKNGKGVISYPDHRKYQGQFKDDLYDGVGRYTDEDGSVYVGEFHLGRFEGRGTYTWPNGDQYVGAFKDNRMDGEGVYIRSNGERYAGQFVSNEISTIELRQTLGPD